MKWANGRGLQLHGDTVQIIFAILATIIMKRTASSGFRCYRQQQQQKRHATGDTQSLTMMSQGICREWLLVTGCTGWLSY